MDLGFIMLADEPPRELVLGFVGQFWTASGKLERLEPGEFREIATPGRAKAVMNFAVTRLEDGRSRLTTESRARGFDEASRRKLERYIFFTKHLRGVLRWSSLRACKRGAEAAVRHRTPEPLDSAEHPAMSNDTSGANPRYVLGHTDHELDRLRAQARLLEPVTRQFLREAGVTRGMHVLDVGSGAGEVAFLAAELVGEAGSVLGTDRVPTAVAVATRAARERGLRNVAFREGDPAQMEFGRRFDAVIGRYVLPFQAAPSSLLRGVARHLVPGGLLVFHEPDWTCVRSFPPAPLYDRACRWIADTTRLSGQSWNFLDQAHRAFVDAGLPPPTMRMQTFVGGDSNSREWLMAVGDIVESLLPAMVRLGVARADEVDLESFRDRLLQEATSNRSVIVGRSELGIWTTAPRDPDQQTD